MNWKTTAWGLLFGGCRLADLFVPGISVACGIVETIAVTGGFISAADAAKVKDLLDRR
jgi:hypothetical protein